MGGGVVGNRENMHAIGWARNVTAEDVRLREWLARRARGMAAHVVNTPDPSWLMSTFIANLRGMVSGFSLFGHHGVCLDDGEFVNEETLLALAILERS